MGWGWEEATIIAVVVIFLLTLYTGIMLGIAWVLLWAVNFFVDIDITFGRVLAVAVILMIISAMFSSWKVKVKV